MSRKTGLHPGPGLVIDSDSSGRRTTAARPTWTPWALPTPLSCLGWWRMCSGPADSPGILLGLCQIGFESLGRRGGRSLRRLGQGKGSTPYLVTSPLGWTKPQVWSASLCYVSTGMERCTSCNLSTPSRLVVILHKGVYYILLGISPRRDPPQ